MRVADELGLRPATSRTLYALLLKTPAARATRRACFSCLAATIRRPSAASGLRDWRKLRESLSKKYKIRTKYHTQPKHSKKKTQKKNTQTTTKKKKEYTEQSKTNIDQESTKSNKKGNKATQHKKHKFKHKQQQATKQTSK